MKILISLILVVGLNAQEMTPVGHELGIFKSDSSIVNSIELSNSSITCQVVTNPTPVPTGPVLLTSMTRLIWGDTTECQYPIDPSFTSSIPIYDQPYVGKMRSYGFDPNGTKTWGQWSLASNNLYQPPSPFTATCASVPITYINDQAPSIVVIFQNPTTSNGIAPVNASCTPSSGSQFAVGSTLVSCSANDAIGRTASCQTTVVVARTVPPPPGDVILPSVSMTVKRSGNSSNFVVTATAKDNVGVTEIKYLLDGLMKSFIANPLVTTSYTMRIDRPGSHLIRVEAKDMAGNIGVASQTINR